MKTTKRKCNNTKKHEFIFRVNDANLDQLLDFDEKIIINAKRFRKNVFKTKISKIIKLNNFSLNNNKNASSSSRSKRDCCQEDSVNIKKSFKCIYTNATSLNNKLSHLRVRAALEDQMRLKFRKHGLMKTHVLIL